VEVLRARDVLLACSDGLHGVVPEGEVLRVLAEVAEPAASVARLIERACELGAPDNVSVVAVVCVEGASAAPRPAGA
jgi:protein phosphatase